MPASKQELVPQARALYAQGLTIQEIADSLDVSQSTVHRWKKDQGDWDALRKNRARKDPHALLAILETQRDELVTTGDVHDGSYADALHKLQRVIQSVRAEFRDVSTALGVLEDFARWCGEQLSEDDLFAARRLVESYLDHLKRSASP